MGLPRRGPPLTATVGFTVKRARCGAVPATAARRALGPLLAGLLHHRSAMTPGHHFPSLQLCCVLVCKARLFAADTET